MFTKKLLGTLAFWLFSFAVIGCDVEARGEEAVSRVIAAQDYVLGTYGWSADFEFDGEDRFVLVVYASEVSEVEAKQLYAVSKEASALVLGKPVPMASVLIVGDHVP